MIIVSAFRSGHTTGIILHRVLIVKGQIAARLISTRAALPLVRLGALEAAVLALLLPILRRLDGVNLPRLEQLLRHLLRIGGAAFRLRLDDGRRHHRLRLGRLVLLEKLSLVEW